MPTRSAPLFFCAQGWSHMSLCQAEGGIGYCTRIHPLPNSCKVSSPDIETTSRAAESRTAPPNTSCLQHANNWGHRRIRVGSNLPNADGSRKAHSTQVVCNKQTAGVTEGFERDPTFRIDSDIGCCPRG